MTGTVGKGEGTGSESPLINSSDFVRMKPDSSAIVGGIPSGAAAFALVEEGRAYAIYINGKGKVRFLQCVTLSR